MPEADTLDRVKSRKVQVASLPPADSGRGFARLPDKLMDELALDEGDVIEIVGKRSTAARAIRPYGEDENIDIIEHPRLVADRLVTFAKIVGRENVIAGTDCGFATFAGADEIHPSIVWAKFESLVQGAQLASKELWGASS